MKNTISLGFYLNAEDSFRSEKLRQEFLKKAYDTFMEKEDTKGRSFSFEEINKYIDLKKYCKKQKQTYDEKATISVRHTFYRDASSQYAKNNGLEDEWNKKAASFKTSSKYKSESLDNYVKGSKEHSAQAKAAVYVNRVGTEEDAALYQKAKIKNIKIGVNAKFADSEMVYALYKEYGLNGTEIDAYLDNHNIDLRRKNGLVRYYIENALPEDKREEELKNLEESIRNIAKERSRKAGYKKVDVAIDVFTRFLNIRESDLDIALLKYNQDESLSKEELFSYLDAVRTSGKNNDTAHYLYCKFINAYRNNDEIVDNQILRLIPKAANNEELAALEFLYDSKRTCNDGINIIRGMVANGMAGEWEVVPLKRALSKATPKYNDYTSTSDESLLGIKFTSNGVTTSEEDKEQALKFLKDNNMETTMLVYTLLLRNINSGAINVYGNNKKEIFDSPKKVMVR